MNMCECVRINVSTREQSGHHGNFRLERSTEVGNSGGTSTGRYTGANEGMVVDTGGRNTNASVPVGWGGLV